MNRHFFFVTFSTFAAFIVTMPRAQAVSFWPRLWVAPIEVSPRVSQFSDAKLVIDQAMTLIRAVQVPKSPVQFSNQREVDDLAMLILADGYDPTLDKPRSSTQTVRVRVIYNPRNPPLPIITVRIRWDLVHARTLAANSDSDPLIALTMALAYMVHILPDLMDAQGWKPPQNKSFRPNRYKAADLERLFLPAVMKTNEFAQLSVNRQKRFAERLMGNLCISFSDHPVH